MRRVGLAALAALAACATAGERVPPPPPPPSFTHVRTLVLVRTEDGRAGRAKDPLDGLDESLRARGFATRVVELGRDGRPGQAALARLFADLEAWASTPRADRIGKLPFAAAEGGTVAAVAELGVDAVAAYHRLEGRRALAPPPPSPSLQGTALPGTPAAPARGPTGALTLVDRGGHVATFAWGAPAPFVDPGVPLNPAEAIDLLLRTLAGEPPDE
jgi:hypothetical protein